jgi:insertion element IS1 protein InsB
LAHPAQSVLRWVCRYDDHYCTKPPPGDAVVIELDEMWHFLQRKDNKVWIWKAYDRTTGRLVDWECGGRDEQTLRRLFDRLARWKVRLFCTDSYGVYPLVLAVGNHYQGKGETVALERNNGQQRHWTAVLRRRSIVVSKSLGMPLTHPKDALSAQQRRLAIAFRKAHPSLGRSRFWRADVTWLGAAGDMIPTASLLAFHLNGAVEGDDDLYVMINGQPQDAVFIVQAEGCWRLVVDTSRDEPNDFTSSDPVQFFAARQAVLVPSRSVKVLVRDAAAR